MAKATTKVTFTPGPWKVGTDDAALWIEPPRSSDNVICDIVGRTVGQITVEDEANAHVIAAAPELLEALKSLVDEHSAPHYAPVKVRKAQWEAAKAAIAKAEGRNV